VITLIASGGGMPPKKVNPLAGLLTKLFNGIRLASWRPNAAGIQEAQQKVDKLQNFLHRASWGALQAALGTVRDLTPVATGKTRDGWEAEVVEQAGGDTVFRLTHPDEKAINRLNYGTRPHVILPKNKQALRFFVGGKEVFARSVKHPGTPGLGFLDRARAQLDSSLEAIRGTQLKDIR